jgi:hypothetical protein
MTEEVNNRGHSIPRKLRGSNKVLSGRQLQEAEEPGALEEGLGISLENFIAYSVVKTRAILQGCAMSPFRNKGNSRSRSSAEPAKAGHAHCFVSLTLHTRVCG